MESELIEGAVEQYVTLPRREQPRLISRLGRFSETRWIRADALRRDMEYNRSIRPFRVQAISRSFNPDGLGGCFTSPSARTGACTSSTASTGTRPCSTWGWATARFPARCTAT